MKDQLARLIAGEDLSFDQAAGLFDQIMSGSLSEAQIAAVLTAIACKGATVDELAGAASAMRDKATRIRCDDPDAIDTCGTGGDGISTFNVSTTAGIIAAAAGATVAKHGNRTNTRVSGSAEALAALGVNIDADVPAVERCLDDVRIGFLYAIRLHPAMKHAAPVRKALGVRTVFNLLGPLTNPARVRRQIIGVARAELTETIASVLQRLGAVRAMVVSGPDGLCDLSITGPSRVSELADGSIRTYEVTPEELGLTRAPIAALAVTSPQHSAAVIGELLDGAKGPPRDHALLTTAAALVVAGIADTLADGLARAAEALDSGAARHTLQRWAEMSKT